MIGDLEFDREDRGHRPAWSAVTVPATVSGAHRADYDRFERRMVRAARRIAVLREISIVDAEAVLRGERE